MVFSISFFSSRGKERENKGALGNLLLNYRNLGKDSRFWGSFPLGGIGALLSGFAVILWRFKFTNL
ncbi:MAG: hypothetical protein D6805_01330 [Planctomycetota bacterium]|nr:MAG: hypothetical protein D6805_01330 [Planctomycetota bacterium]